MKNKTQFKKNLWDFDAKFLRVVDGDTVELLIDKGMRQYGKYNCRLARINADELHDKDPDKRLNAEKAMAYVQDRIPVEAAVYIISKRLDKYSRPLIELYYQDVNINDELMANGIVEKYK